MKKTNVIFLIIVAMVSLTACGNASGLESNPETEAEFVEYEGEGEVQGGIKSDEEIAELQDEEASYSEEEYSEESKYADDSDDSSVEPTTDGGFVSADSFWQSDGSFDLEGWFTANGGYVMKGGFYDGFEEKDTDITTYEVFISYWTIIVSEEAIVRFSYAGTDDITSYLVMLEDYGQEVVVDQSNNMRIREKSLDALFYLMSLIKEYPDSDNPFQYSEREDIRLSLF